MSIDYQGQLPPGQVRKKSQCHNLNYDSFFYHSYFAWNSNIGKIEKGEKVVIKINGARGAVFMCTM